MQLALLIHLLSMLTPMERMKGQMMNSAALSKRILIFVQERLSSNNYNDPNSTIDTVLNIE